MGEHLYQLYRSIGHRDAIEIAILTLLIYALLRFLNKTRVSGMVRGLGIVLVGFVLLAQVVVAALDLTGLSKVLDYVASGIVFALLDYSSRAVESLGNEAPQTPHRFRG